MPEPGVLTALWHNFGSKKLGPDLKAIKHLSEAWYSLQLLR